MSNIFYEEGQGNETETQKLNESSRKLPPRSVKPSLISQTKSLFCDCNSGINSELQPLMEVKEFPVT